MPRPVVLVHGYSDEGKSFKVWSAVLGKHGYQATEIHLGNYVSLSNEITIKDIAEGFDKALHYSTLGDDEPFDAIVHSTGMLVVREWLAGTSCTSGKPELAKQRQARLKRLIGLAPATFGSPMAHKGRSWLGAIFKGGKEPGPDFMEAGDLVLAGLELGSPYTWDLAHRDFLSDPAVYGKGPSTPFPFIFIGLNDYGWLKRAVTEPGTDGTVRWSGAGFNSRKIHVDLTVEPAKQQRVRYEPWKNVAVPQVFLPDLNHGTILREPSQALIDMVLDALKVSSSADYADWAKKHCAGNAAALQAAKAKRWQQLIVHAVDERGDGISDYFIEVGKIADKRFKQLSGFDLDVHAYTGDQSYRAFHVDLDKLKLKPDDILALRVIASSGTELVGYLGFDSSEDLVVPERDRNKWDAVIQFDPIIGTKEVKFFFPYTTTLVEIRMNREPIPREDNARVNKIFWFGA